ncbi:unnamed protein product, partial [Ceratitis capitata]
MLKILTPTQMRDRLPQCLTAKFNLCAHSKKQLIDSHTVTQELLELLPKISSLKV